MKMAPIANILVGVCEGKQVRATCPETIAADSGEGSLIIHSVLDRTPEDEFGIIVAVQPCRVDSVANGKRQLWALSRRVKKSHDDDDERENRRKSLEEVELIECRAGNNLLLKQN